LAKSTLGRDEDITTTFLESYLAAKNAPFFYLSFPRCLVIPYLFLLPPLLLLS
jgi:hypothetical protein